MELQNFWSVIHNYKAVFLDSYGVLKNSSGVIEGVQETIDFLNQERIPFYVLTNDASRSPEQIIQRYAEQGLTGIHLDQMVTSGMMTREYLQYKVPDGKIAYLGTENAANYIEEVGLVTVPIHEVEEIDYQSIAAVAFLDDEGFDWQLSINKTINVLRRQNVSVVIANSDKTYPISSVEVALATGGLAEIIEKVTGKQFIHFGKPDGQMFLYAFDKLNRGDRYISKGEILMVGDTLGTDIVGGNKFGLHTMLTLSGNTNARQAEELIHTRGIIPDYVVGSIAKR
ncbi:MAG TPA: HAD-IIA family hydrolase [Saprospiraceae bacterium]|nr:HAD-IIA family hydrolase [Saprospiraceae bacterium]